MADKSKIAWTESTWNPVTGCTKIGAGCKNCYAERMTKRFWKQWGCEPPPNHFKVKLHPERLDQPLRWKKPRRIFVNSMSDLFHKDVPNKFISRVFDRILDADQHTYQILTKRYRRAAKYIDCELPGHVQILFSASNQAEVDTAVPILMQIPAAVRGLSLEPLLGPIDLANVSWRLSECSVVRGTVLGTNGRTFSPCGASGKGVDWVIVGGESGPGARPMHPNWVRSIRYQCFEAGVPFFFKGWGAWYPLHPSYVHPPIGKKLGQYAVAYWDNNAERFINGTYKGIENDLGEWDIMIRIGKKKSGRILDGRTWEEYPE
jgi:protein gp37